MARPSFYFTKPLSRPLRTTDADTLITIGHACRYMSALPKHRERRRPWQHARRLILDRASVAAIMRQLERALFLDGKMNRLVAHAGTGGSRKLTRV